MGAHSYLHRMIIFGMLLSTLPMLLTGIAAFFYTTNQSELHQLQTNKQLLNQMQSNVEHKLGTISYMLDQATRWPATLEQLSAPSLGAKTSSTDQLQTEFQNMRSWEPSMDIALINQTQDWLIDHAGMYLSTEFPLALPMKEMLSKTLTSGWQLIPSSVFNNQEHISDNGCIYHIALARPVPHLNTPTHSAVIAGIPACSLQSPADMEQTSSAGLIIVNREQRILAHPNPAYIGKPLAGMDMREEESGSNMSKLLPSASSHVTGEAKVRLGDSRYSLSYAQSSLRGWTYMLLTPMNVLTQEYTRIAEHTLHVSLIMLLVSLGLTWLGSKRMHVPIRRLLAHVGLHYHPSVRQTMAKKRTDAFPTEFEQIQARFTQIVDSSSRLENRLNQYVLQTRVFFVMNMLLGKCSPSALRSGLIEHGYGHYLDEWQHVAVIVIQADLVQQSKYTVNDLDLLLFAVQNMMEETLNEHQQLYPVVLEQTVVTIFGAAESDPVKFASHLHAITGQLQQQVEQVLQLTVSIGFSQPWTSLLQVHRAYSEALKALHQRLRLGTGIIIQYEQPVHSSSHTSISYPSTLEYALVQAIQIGDEGEAEVLLSQMLDHVLDPECNSEDYHLALARLLTRILQMLHESGIRLDQTTSGHDSLYKELFSLRYASEVEHWFNQRMIKPIILLFKERQVTQYRHISDKMIAIIQQEYDRDLTLEECAARLHYNANYLSSVFRKETGSAFSEYLAKHRFTIAKRWLEETDMTVKDISNRLRYNNPQNFIRSFRKWEGITPGQYRLRQQNLHAGRQV